MRRIFAHIILMADGPNPNIGDRLRYFWNIFITFTPVAFMLDVLNWWFTENKQFGTFICVALLINMLVGGYMHLRAKTFSMKDFIFKNLELCFMVVIVYVMLEMLRYTAGNNLAGEIFKVSIQVMTLLYPTSKVLKNVFIASKGKYPPEFLMKKLYNFEKGGNLSEFFSNDKPKEQEAA